MDPFHDLSPGGVTVDHIVEALRVQDLFVLRRLEGERFFNLGGVGRGAGWSGNVEVEARAEPWISRTFTEQVIRKRSGVPFRVFGPYWAHEAAAVLSGENLLVLGGDGVTSLSDEELTAAAERAAAGTTKVPLEKVRDDEAEVQQALDDLLGFEGTSIEEAATHLASTAAQALSCEFGAVLLFQPSTRVFTANEGWMPRASDDELIAALLPLHQLAQDGLYVEHDSSQSPFPFPPLSYEDGLVTRCCVPLGEGGRVGMLFAAHARSEPRGFTSLCQQVARSIGEAGAKLLV